MSETQSRSSRQAIRQTADLAPLTMPTFPVRLGQSWTYRSTTRQVAGTAVDESVAVEQERVAGVTPMAGTDARWTVNVDLEITYADKSRERFGSVLVVGEDMVAEEGSVPFLTAEAGWEHTLEDGSTVTFRAADGVSVVVPAGSFTDCRHVHEVARRDGEVLYEREDWYAPGIGRVMSRYTRTSPLGSIVEERQLLGYAE